MKNLFLLIAILFSAMCYSQQNIDEELQLYLSDFKHFNFEKLKNKEFKYSVDTLNLPQYLRNTFYKKVTRDLDFGIKESIYSICLNYVRDDDFLKHTSNILHVLSKDSTIIGIICLNEYKKIKTTHFDESEIRKYITRHDSLYQTTTQIDDFVNELTQQTVYGYLCGIAPVLRDIPEKDGLKFNDMKNIEVFRKWIRSYNPELQTYGVDAINYIYKQPKFSIGKKQSILEKQDKDLVKYVKYRNSIINTCSGCFVGIYERVFW